MSQITKPMLLDETFKQKMNITKGLLGTIAREGAPQTTNWNFLEELASDGTFETLYDIGTTFSDTWKDTAAGTEYTFPWMLNHIGNVELQDGETLVNRPWLQMKYAHPFGVQFSQCRAFLRCPSGLAAGTYNIHFAQNWSSLTVRNWHFTLTQDVPEGGSLAGFRQMPDSAYTTRPVYSYDADGKTVIETVDAAQGEASGATDLGTLAYATRSDNLNSMQETFYGWNRWKTSALRQYLNSDAGVGGWWTKQDDWDIAPSQLTTKSGFLYHYKALAEDTTKDATLRANAQAFLDSIKPVKVITYPNTVYDDPQGNTPDITYDKVFLPSLEQMYINPQKAGEGEYHERWKRQSGRETVMAQYSTYPQIITYAVEDHSSAQHVRLRSAYRGYAYFTWCVVSSGYVSYYYYGAYSANRFSPLVVL